METALKNLEDAQELAGQLTSYTQCFDDTKVFKLAAEAIDSSDFRIFNKATSAAQVLVNDATKAVDQILDLQAAYDKAVEAKDAEELLIPDLEEKLSNAEGLRDEIASEASIARKALEDAQAKLLSDEDILLAELDLEIAKGLPELSDGAV